MIEMSPATILYYVDIIGVVSCVIAGTVQAYRHNLDPMGTLLIAAVSAIGGGTVRDLLLDRNPVFWMADPTYLYLIIVVSICVQIFFVHVQKINKILRITDALGLAAFTIIGIEAALSFNVHPMIAIFMGVTTSSFGGIVRDVICNEVPLVLRREVYILASIAGGLCYFAMLYMQFSQSLVYICSGSVTFLIRVLAIYQNWHLPKLSKEDQEAN